MRRLPVGRSEPANNREMQKKWTCALIFACQHLWKSYVS